MTVALLVLFLSLSSYPHTNKKRFYRQRDMFASPRIHHTQPEERGRETERDTQTEEPLGRLEITLALVMTVDMMTVDMMTVCDD